MTICAAVAAAIAAGTGGLLPPNRGRPQGVEA